MARPRSLARRGGGLRKVGRCARFSAISTLEPFIKTTRPRPVEGPADPGAPSTGRPTLRATQLRDRHRFRRNDALFRTQAVKVRRPFRVRLIAVAPLQIKTSFRIPRGVSRRRSRTRSCALSVANALRRPARIARERRRPGAGSTRARRRSLRGRRINAEGDARTALASPRRLGIKTPPSRSRVLSVRPSPFPARRALAVVVLAALALAGCGRYGPLEPPPDASAQAKAAAPKASDASPEAMNPQMKPKIPPITPPNQPFFLDFLLK